MNFFVCDIIQCVTGKKASTAYSKQRLFDVDDHVSSTAPELVVCRH